MARKIAIASMALGIALFAAPAAAKSNSQLGCEAASFKLPLGPTNHLLYGGWGDFASIISKDGNLLIVAQSYKRSRQDWIRLAVFEREGDGWALVGLHGFETPDSPNTGLPIPAHFEGARLGFQHELVLSTRINAVNGYGNAIEPYSSRPKPHFVYCADTWDALVVPTR